MVIYTSLKAPSLCHALYPSFNSDIHHCWWHPLSDIPDLFSHHFSLTSCESKDASKSSSTKISSSIKKIKWHDGKDEASLCPAPMTEAISPSRVHFCKHTHPFLSGQKWLAFESPQIFPPSQINTAQSTLISWPSTLKKYYNESPGRSITRERWVLPYVTMMTRLGRYGITKKSMQWCLMTLLFYTVNPPFCFGWDTCDKETFHNIMHMNYFRVIRKLAAKFSCLSKHKSLAAHSSKGPFIIQMDSRTPDQIIIKNSKGTEAVKLHLVISS